jgi:hypothetical protein
MYCDPLDTKYIEFRRRFPSQLRSPSCKLMTSWRWNIASCSTFEGSGDISMISGVAKTAGPMKAASGNLWRRATLKTVPLASPFNVRMVASVFFFLWVVVLIVGCATPRPSGEIPVEVSRRGPVLELYVSVDGDDAGSGAKENPFATLTNAQRAVRNILRRDSRSDIQVFIRGGRYELTEPWRFGPEDSGSARQAIVYKAFPGEEVEISGGRILSGWSMDTNGVWSVPMDGTLRYARQLFVNGRRATRARFPSASASDPYLRLTSSSLAADLSRWTVSLSAPVPDAATGATGRIEICMFGDWAITRKRVDTVLDPHNFQLKPPHLQGHPLLHPKGGYAAYLENLEAFLTDPGEWFWDEESGWLKYLPMPGENMDSATVVVPQLERLLVLEGGRLNPIQNLHFVGLDFRHAEWQIPDVGYVGLQATYYQWEVPWYRNIGNVVRIPSAIVFDHVVACGLWACSVSSVGGGGIELRERAMYNHIVGNSVLDVGGNGISVGHHQWIGGSPGTISQNQIRDNLVSKGGQIFHGAVGIWTGLTSGNVIANNRVHDMPYTGISVGWEWNPKMTDAGGHRITRNHVHDVMKILSDGGGIYTLGRQPHTEISGNLIHNIHRNPVTARGAPNDGIFFDQGSSRLVVENNLIYHVSGESVRFNQSGLSANVFSRNYFGHISFAEGVSGEHALLSGLGRAWHVIPSHHLNTPRFTWSLWINPDEDGISESAAAMSIGTSAHADEYVSIQIANKRVIGLVNAGGGNNNVRVVSAPEGMEIEAGRWVHVALSYDDRDLKLYINGALVAQEFFRHHRRGGVGPLYVGGDFRGRLDDVRIYGRAIDPEVIGALAGMIRPDVAASVGYRQGGQAPETQPDSGGGSRLRGDPLTRGLIFHVKPDELYETITRIRSEVGPQSPFREIFAGDEQARLEFMTTGWQVLLAQQQQEIPNRQTRTAKRVLGFIPWLLFSGFERVHDHERVWEP